MFLLITIFIVIGFVFHTKRKPNLKTLLDLFNTDDVLSFSSYDRIISDHWIIKSNYKTTPIYFSTGASLDNEKKGINKAKNIFFIKQT